MRIAVSRAPDYRIALVVAVIVIAFELLSLALIR
jgi:hypothetical protein